MRHVFLTSIDVSPSATYITAMDHHPEPVLPRIRIKISPSWGDPTAPAWVSYTVLEVAGQPCVQVEESRRCFIQFRNELEPPQPRPKRRKPWRVALADAEIAQLKQLLAEAMLPLPGVMDGRGYCDAATVELSIQQFGLASTYSWEGEPPEAWAVLGKITDLITGVAHRDDP